MNNEASAFSERRDKIFHPFQADSLFFRASLVMDWFECYLFMSAFMIEKSIFPHPRCALILCQADLIN
jgi:hypothetical protein